MNCILYARVSTEEQAELSIPAQIQAIRDYARQHEWTVVEEFLEPGVSAKTTARPALQRLLARIGKNDPPVQVLLVHKIDRLARNVYDHATIKALLQQRGIRLASVVENVDDTIPGQLVENIMASIAQFYSANLGEEVKKGMRQKVRTGGWPHMPPLGYRVVRVAGQKSSIEIDPLAGPLVRLAFELYATGRWGVRALADHLQREGLKSRTGKRMAQSNIRKMLANPFFVGTLRWEGKQFPGKHEPLIPRELFDQVQITIRRRHEDPKTHLSPTAFPLKIVAVCASCRGTMTAEMHGAWSYYRCCRRMQNKAACPARLCNAKVAHAALEHICRRLTLSDEMSDRIAASAEAILERRRHDARQSDASLRRHHEQLSTRHQKMTQSFVAGQITAETFQGLAGTLQGEIVKIEHQISAGGMAVDALLVRVRQMLRDAKDIWILYGSFSPVRQVELLRAVFANVVLGPSGIVGYVLHEPFAALFATSEGQTGAAEKATMVDPSAIAETCVAVADSDHTLAADRTPPLEQTA